MSDKKKFNKNYNKLIKDLQIKLVHMQDWVIENDKKVEKNQFGVHPWFSL